MSYAKGTVVAVEKSRSELDRLLTRAGATQRGMGADEDAGLAYVVFRLADRSVRIQLPLPKNDHSFATDGRGSLRSPDKRRKAYEQACRERWRVLLLLVKAKLEAVALGISTIEREFLADVYLADGRTVHQAIIAPLREAYESGITPPLLGPRSP